MCLKSLTEVLVNVLSTIITNSECYSHIKFSECVCETSHSVRPGVRKMILLIYQTVRKML